MDIRQDILSNRKSFLFYFDWDKYVQKMDDAQAGKLLKAILALALRGEQPDFSDDLALELSFIGIGDTIVRDTEKYVDKCRKNRENGANGGRPPKKEEPTDNPQKPNGYFGFSEKTGQNPQKPDRDIDIDTDSGRETDRGIDSDIGMDSEVIGDGYLRKYVYQDFISQWNQYAKYGVEKITELTEWQKTAIDNLVIKYDWIKVLEAMKRIEASDYLLGKTSKSNPISLKWFLVEENMVKVLEGKYDNKDYNPNPSKWQ